MQSLGADLRASALLKSALAPTINRPTHRRALQTCNGAVACQLMDCLHPGSINMRKVDFNLRNDYEFIANYKELQKAFDTMHVPRVRARHAGRAAVGPLGAAKVVAASAQGESWRAGKRGWKRRCGRAARNAERDALAAGANTLLRAAAAACLQAFQATALSKGKLQDNIEFMQVRTPTRPATTPLGCQLGAACKAQMQKQCGLAGFASGSLRASCGKFSFPPLLSSLLSPVLQGLLGRGDRRPGD